MPGVLSTYLQCRLTGAPIALRRLVGMALRKVDLRTVAYTYIRLKRAGAEIAVEDLETAWLAGAELPTVASATLVSLKESWPLGWDEFEAMSRAGLNPLEGANGLVNPELATIEHADARARIVEMLAERGRKLSGPAADSAARHGEWSELMGAVGEALDHVAPVGRVRIGSSTYPARSSHAAIDAGWIIRVIGQDSDALVVEAV